MDVSCRYWFYLLSPMQTDVTLLANRSQHYWMLDVASLYSAISRKVVGKSACDNPEW